VCRFEQLEEQRRREEEARRQQNYEEKLLEKMLANQQAVYFDQFRKVKDELDQPQSQRMQVRHRANYPENAMEKPGQSQNQSPLSNPEPFYYAGQLRFLFFLRQNFLPNSN